MSSQITMIYTYKFCSLSNRYKIFNFICFIIYSCYRMWSTFNRLYAIFKSIWRPCKY